MDEKRIRTLDAAKSEILRLERELETAKKPASVVSAGVQKPMVSPTVKPEPAATLESADMPTLKRALEMAHHANNKEAFENIMREYRRRRQL